ncbi:MAG: hypothetical protein ONB05_05420, partial [candidate division KSB1 bacterium]|nr:hypothetical protein [candidate division KSB1 bacterium]
SELFVELIKFTFAKDPSDPTRFLAYPYAAGEEGFANREANRERWGFGQVRTYYHRVDGEVDAIGFSLRGRLYSRVGLSLDYTRYCEQLSNNQTDHLNVFRLGLMKSIFINQWLILDLDFGVRTVDSCGGLEIGVHSQFFSRKPLVQEFWGSIGKMAGDVFGELNASVGVMVNRFQVDVGYRLLKWGDEYLTGGQVGLQLWF